MESVFNFIKDGGVIMYPLILMSLAAVVIVVERLMAYKALGDVAPGLVSEVLRLVRAGRDAEALKLTESRSGVVAASLATILRNRNRPAREVEGLVEEVGQDHFLRLERMLPILDSITTIAPLLGLLGTIIGMTRTFHDFAEATKQGAATTDVLAGVGEALYATATGIGVAVICFAAYNYFSARLRSITGETAQAATKLMNALAERSSGVTPTVTAATDPAAPRAAGVQAPARA